MIKRLLYLIFLLSLWLGGIALQTVVGGAAVTLFVVYIIAPLVFHYSPSLQRHIVFLNFLNVPNVDYNSPEREGLPGTRNFYLQTERNVNVGVWHILPESLVSSAPEKGSSDFEDWYVKSMSDHRPVILYLHGNTSSRATAHRIELYSVLRKMDYHVVAFDYRGYADSSPVQPNETGVVHDAKVVYRYVRERCGSSPLFVWGHSLGTGVSAHAVGDLCLEGENPTALVLESPFNNIKDEVKFHPLSSIFRKMPKFDWLFLKPLASSGIDFRTEEHIAHVAAPVLILHAEDDLVVPFTLGKKLYDTAQRVRSQTAPPVKFIDFAAKFGYAHKYICRAPELPDIIRDFFCKAVEMKN
ncbi:lysophosphatidylserine lipase ABHD12-like [Eriocheir sinensis]|uniref:lysophosphatidylserine lipase ABHD12-like n=1 Tax=Eriocheir sinensis TaxID=95602 RepID=UPI0021C9FEDE|nr:lysophosphatidylserine lipase ABHD12-like [Eriocheir sinensis]XP_050731191.1 lysophosphatidylserine lipase ABHD12-like [Eriocheir sinensis]XP_050731192.1 lysophosphatidylserine lipase ABHD12-like [Eriocheir sinensis]